MVTIPKADYFKGKNNLVEREKENQGPQINDRRNKS